VCLRTLYRSTIRKTAKFFASRRTKYLNILLIMLYYITSQSYITKAITKMLVLLSWWSGGVGTASDAGHHHVGRLLHTLLCGGCRRPDGANQDGS
jgi:hypothetical protein